MYRRISLTAKLIWFSFTVKLFIGLYIFFGDDTFLPPPLYCTRLIIIFFVNLFHKNDSSLIFADVIVFFCILFILDLVRFMDLIKISFHHNILIFLKKYFQWTFVNLTICIKVSTILSRLLKRWMLILISQL